MKKLFTLVLCAFALCIIPWSCDKEDGYPDFEKLISAQNITVNPAQLEAVGGKIPATITIQVPPRFTPPTAEVTLTAYIVWDGGEVKNLSRRISRRGCARHWHAVHLP